MKLTISYNGFHGRADVTIMAPGGTKPGDLVEVSERTARRINAAVCGMSSCRCGEGIALEPGTWSEKHGALKSWAVEVPAGEMRGNYPQS